MESHLTPSPTVRRWCAWCIHGLDAAENFCNHNGGWILGLILAVFSAYSWYESSRKALWFDELLGLAVASTRSVSELFSALARPVDLNPPLYALLERASLTVFGRSPMAARLPAFLGMLLFLSCLYFFVSRCLSSSYGLLAALVLIGTPVAGYAWEGRPYGVVLGFTGIAMVSYQQRLRRHGRASLIIFLFVCFCLPLTHYYAVLIVIAFLVPPVLRWLAGGLIDLPLVLGTALAPALALFLVRGLISSQRAVVTHYYSPGSIFSFREGASSLGIPAWAIGFVIAVLSFGCWLTTVAGREDSYPMENFSTAELTLSTILLCLPLIGAIATIATHAYAARYFLATVAGYAVLVCYLTSMIRLRCRGSVVFLMVAAAAVFGCENLGEAVKHRHDPLPFPALPSLLRTSDLPVVFQTALDYLQARELYPDLRSRLYYVAEPDKAVALSGANNNDLLMISLAATEPEQIIHLEDMAEHGRRWIFIPNSEPFGWLQSCFLKMNLSMAMKNAPGPSGTAIDFFMVEIPERDTGSNQWCSAGGP